MINLTKTVLSQALDRIQQATLIVNARTNELPIAYVNPAFEVLTGLDASFPKVCYPSPAPERSVRIHRVRVCRVRTNVWR
jgi:hypothetical protein